MLRNRFLNTKNISVYVTAHNIATLKTTTETWQRHNFHPVYTASERGHDDEDT